MRPHEWFQRAALVTITGLSPALLAADAHAAELAYQAGIGFSFSIGQGAASARIYGYGEASRFGERWDRASLFGAEVGVRGVEGESNRLEALARAGWGRVELDHIGHLSYYRADLFLGLSHQLGWGPGLALGIGGRLGPAQARITRLDVGDPGGPSLFDLGIEHGWVPAIDLYGGVGWGVEGRPLRDGGPLRKPRVEGDRGLAEVRRWIETGEEELAAVAAFVQLARELELLGAPAELVERCYRAADEEVIHGLMALGRAAQLQDQPLSVTPLRPRHRAMGTRESALARLGLESLADGLGNEGEMAVLHEAATSTRSNTEARIHARIAREEATHATLGGDIAHWCGREGGPWVRQILSARAARGG